jgi:hypothetical protein
MAQSGQRAAQWLLRITIRLAGDHFTSHHIAVVKTRLISGRRNGQVMTGSVERICALKLA